MLFGSLAILASACGPAPTESVSATLYRAFQVEDNEAMIARSSDGAELGVYEIDFEEAPNLDRPTSITTTFPDGSVHAFIDVGSRRAGALGNFPALAAGYNKTHLDIWYLRDHFVVDTTDYNGALVVPGSPADVGPMRAGVFTVDAVHFASPAEFTRLVARSEPLDAPAVFDRLPAILTNSSVSEDGGSITATANFGQLTDILGHDIEDLAGSDAFPIAALDSGIQLVWFLGR